VPRTRAFLFV